MEQKFYKCEVCGKIVAMVKGTMVPTMCCGKPMDEMIAGTVEASKEKHIPEYKTEDGIVKVNIGSVEHPMTKEHYIEWVVLETENGKQIKNLTPEQKPYVEFLIQNDEKIKAVYAYCNLHGLWKA